MTGSPKFLMEMFVYKWQSVTLTVESLSGSRNPSCRCASMMTFYDDDVITV